MSNKYGSNSSPSSVITQAITSQPTGCVAEGLSHQKERLELLNKRLSELIYRISPALKPEVPQPSSKDAQTAERSLSVVAESIVINNTIISSITEQITDTIDRCDL